MAKDASLHHPRLGDFIALTTLALVIWLAWFSESAGFGFYEDDYSTITPHLYGTWESTLSRVWYDLLSFRQGKPICYLTMPLLSRLAGSLGGKPAIYPLAFVILTLNAWLGFALLRRLRTGLTFALVGALAFALAPADTSRAFLCHAFGIQVGFCFLWVALHSYLSGNRKTAWVFAALALLTYEPLFALFWAGSFLVDIPQAERRRSVFRQGAGIALVLVLFVGVRFSFGESRVTDQIPERVPRKIARNILIGPAAAVSAWVERAGAGKRHPRRWALFAVLALVLVATARKPGSSNLSLRWIAGVAVLLVVMAYCVDLLNEPHRVSGRSSRIHSAGGLGLALLFAVFAAWLFGNYSKARVWALSCALAWVFSGWVAFGKRVQRDYAGAWKSQQEVWSSIAEQIPDATQKDLVLLDFPDRRPHYREAIALGWSMPLVPKQLFRYPVGFSAPRVETLRKDWRDDPFPRSAILLRWEKGGFKRLKPGDVGVQKVDGSLKPRGRPILRAPRPMWQDVVS